MKVWVIAKVIGTGTPDDEFRPCCYIKPEAEIGRWPTNVAEMDLYKSAYCNSQVPLGNGRVLCCFAGTPKIIREMLSNPDVEQITDDKAEEIIKSIYPERNLSDFDVIDHEVGFLAIIEGIEEYKHMLVPGSNSKEIELTIMKRLCEKYGLTTDYWDAEATKTTKWKRGIDIEKDILSGKAEAHEFVLSKIREKIARK
jgi:hypothetical protein